MEILKFFSVSGLLQKARHLSKGEDGEFAKKLIRINKTTYKIGPFEIPSRMI